MAKAAAATNTIVRRTSTAATKRLDEAKDKLKRKADAARLSRNENRAMMTRLGSGFALGYATKKGWLDKLPDTGIPKLAVAGIAAKAAGYYTKGKNGDILNGVGDAALIVLSFQFGSDQTTAGVGANRGAANPKRAAALEEKFRRQLAEAREELEDRIEGYDDDVYDDEVGDYDDDEVDAAGSAYTSGYDDDDDVGDYDDEFDDVGDVYDDVSGTTSVEEAADFGYF